MKGRREGGRFSVSIWFPSPAPQLPSPSPPQDHLTTLFAVYRFPVDFNSLTKRERANKRVNSASLLPNAYSSSSCPVRGRPQAPQPPSVAPQSEEPVLRLDHTHSKIGCRASQVTSLNCGAKCPPQFFMDFIGGISGWPR